MKLFSMYAATLIVAGSFEMGHATEKESADRVWHQDFVKAKCLSRQWRKAVCWCGFRIGGASEPGLG